MKKAIPALNLLKIFCLSFGFLGIQLGYSLQSGNTSRILSALGANVEHLGYFWLAAPLAGILVQPLIGMSSDNTWTRLGRRIPFILLGAIISIFAMFLMPNAEFFIYLVPPLLFGAVMLLTMDVAFNITMQPFRALVGDMMPEKQHNIGYGIQSFLINAGSVIGSLLPFLLTWIGLSNVPKAGAKVAPTVIWSFYIGGILLLLTVLVTVFTTKEHPPTEYADYHGNPIKPEKQSLIEITRNTPAILWRLGLVQFFSWFALFLMWVYTTSGVAQNVWHTVASDGTSQAFNDAGNWVGVIFGFYSFVAALYSLVIGRLADYFGRKTVYFLSLILGGLGLISMIFIHDKYILLISMVGVGVAWTAILSMPYAILSANLAADKMGVYMGIFNGTIALPQIVAGLLGGLLLYLVGGSAIMMLGVAGASMLIAALAIFIVK